MPLAIPKPDEAHYIPTAVTTHEPAVTRPHLLGQQAAVHLGFDFPGDQLLVDEFADRFVSDLATTRELSLEETRKVKAAIERLHSLTSFPVTALQLATGVDEEQVAEVFVRINSEGKQLNQSDFILTLMSVFWDEGRAGLEEFCREARKPSPGRPSPFNLNRFIGH